MKEKSRDAIRKVLGPSMYGMMLVRSDGSALCSDCVGETVKELISDLRNGHTNGYQVLSLIEIDSGHYCDSCGEYCSEYYLEGDLEMIEAQESLHTGDSDLY